MASSRERVKAAIDFNRPDRCPIRHLLLPAAILKHEERLLNIARRYPQDFGPSEFSVPKIEVLSAMERKGVHKDEWGTVWKSKVDGLEGQVLMPPLKDWRNLSNLRYPPLPSEQDIDRMKRWCGGTRDKGYFVLVGFNPGNFFERMQWLRGFTNLMEDFLKRPKELYVLADNLLDYSLKSIKRALESKPDAILFSDDWGTQQSLMVNPSFWRDFFKPKYKKMFNIVHDGGAYVFFHSDGHIVDIIPDLAEIGVNVIWPQFSCHKMEELAEAIHGRLCVLSDVDRQYTLPFGTPKQVMDYTKRMIDLFGYRNEGGLICQGEINFDVPLENVEAMYEGFITYGRYKWQ